MAIPAIVTATYVRLLEEADRELAEKKAQRLALAAIKRCNRTPEQQRTFTNLANQLKTCAEHVVQVRELDVTPVLRLKIAIEVQHEVNPREGDLWTPAEQAMWNKNLAQNEGRGEQALKLRHGLDEAPTRQDADLIKKENGLLVLYEEVKNVHGPSGLQSIQTGKHGLTAVGIWLTDMYDCQGLTGLNRAERERVCRGEITKALMGKLPIASRDSLNHSLKPSKVFGDYQAINVTTPDGFLRIPRGDFDNAFKLGSITKGGAKYVLQSDYLLRRCLIQPPGPAMKIGLVPGSYKPYHAGHDAVIRLAATENDKVTVFVSLTDRDNVSGKAMEQVWKDQIEPSLPKNVEVVYGGSPVGRAFEVLGKANEAGSKDVFSIYSDPSDTKRFDTLPKYASALVVNGQVKTRAIERASTVDVSGTQMRQWLASGNKVQFIKNLPQSIDGEAVWTMLSSSVSKD